jgi:hypothetical protein
MSNNNVENTWTCMSDITTVYVVLGNSLIKNIKCSQLDYAHVPLQKCNAQTGQVILNVKPSGVSYLPQRIPPSLKN